MLVQLIYPNFTSRPVFQLLEILRFVTIPKYLAHYTDL